MERRHARVPVAGDEQHRRVALPGLDVVIRRVGAQNRELGRVLGRAVLGHPVRRHQEAVVAQHVEQWIGADHRPEQLRPLRQGGADQEASVRSPRDREPRRARVLAGDQPLGGGDEVVEDVLLLVEHPRLVPRLAELPATAQVRHREHAAVLDPERRARREERPDADVEPAVAGEEGGVAAVEADAVPVRDEHRDLRAVLGRVPDLLDLDVLAPDRHLEARPHIALPASGLIAVDRGGLGQRAEGEERLVLAPVPAHAAHGPEAGQRQLTQQLPVGLVDAEPRRDVLEAVQEELASGQGHVRDHRRALRDQLLPAFAAWVGEIDRHHPAPGRLPVRKEVEPVGGDGAGEARVEVVHDRHHRRALPEVLDVDVDLRPGRTVLGLHLQPMPVAGDADVDVLLGPVSLAEDLFILRDGGAHRVAEHPRPLLRLPAVVGRRPIGRERHSLVAGAGKRVGQVAARVDVHEADLDLVLAAVPDAVGEHPAVERDVLEAHRDAVIGAQAVGVQQHLVGRLRPRPHVQHEQVLIGFPLREEGSPAAHEGHADRVDLDELREPALGAVASGKGSEHRIGVGVLRGDPLAGRRRVLVLEPAIRVRDLDSAEGLHDGVAAGVRRLRRLRAAEGEGGAGSEREGKAEGPKRGRGGHGDLLGAARLPHCCHDPPRDAGPC